MPQHFNFAEDKLVFGDTDRRLAGFAVAGDQDIVVQGPPFEGSVTVVGDASVLSGFALGGDDSLTAMGFSARAFGDAFSLKGMARGGDDVVSVNSFGSSIAYGDAETIAGNAVGGDDEVSAGSSGNATAYGDAALITGSGAGGDDTVTGGTALSGNVLLFGDAERLEGRSVGGDDVLIAPFTSSTMWGDAAFVGPGATTGADSFVISFGNAFGHTIMDFEPGKDVVELNGYGLSGFEDLASHFVTTPSGVEIDFGPTDSIFLADITVSQLTQADFLLA